MSCAWVRRINGFEFLDGIFLNDRQRLGLAGSVPWMGPICDLILRQRNEREIAH